METFLKWIGAIGSAIHWITGWLVHPKDGGCCKQTDDEIKEKFDNLK